MLGRLLFLRYSLVLQKNASKKSALIFKRSSEKAVLDKKYGALQSKEEIKQKLT